MAVKVCRNVKNSYLCRELKKHNNMDLIKNKYLTQWINENYPEMIENGESSLIELSYVDMDDFAFWMQDKIHNESMKEAHVISFYDYSRDVVKHVFLNEQKAIEKHKELQDNRTWGFYNLSKTLIE